MAAALLATGLAVAGAELLSAWIASRTGAGAWRPGLGIAVAAVFLVGGRALPGVLAGELLAVALGAMNPAAGPGPWHAVTATAIAGLVGVGLRRRLPPVPRTWSVRDTLVLVAAALFAAVAEIGVVALRGAAGEAPAQRAAEFFAAGVGAAVGVLLAVPAIAGLLPQPFGRGRAARASTATVAAHVAFTLAVGAAAFLLRGPTGERFWSLYFIPLLWSAFALGTTGVIAGQLLVAVEAVALAVISNTPATTVTNFHFFLFTFIVTGLLLAAALGARHAAERARGRSEALLAGAFRSIDDGMVIFDAADGTIRDANDAAARLVGRPRHTLGGTSIYTLETWSGDQGGELRALVHDGTPIRDHLMTLHRADGAVRDVAVVAERVAVNDDRVTVALFRDVTEMRLIERQRQQSQKLEAVGLLAGSVAHDFNNILAAIGTAGEMLHEVTPADDERRADIESIVDATQRGAQLTRQLLRFSRQEPEQPPSPVAVPEVIDEMLGLLQRLVGKGVEIKARFADDVRVMAAPGQLEQVVLNLAVNARDAMDGRGTLEIEARSVELGSPSLVAELGRVVAAGRWAVLTVRDSGSGIDPAIVARIFEPFFTTKSADRGTGLGLATVYGITRSAGGHVGVHSAVGRGATFVVYWPSA